MHRPPSFLVSVNCFASMTDRQGNNKERLSEVSVSKSNATIIILLNTHFYGKRQLYMVMKLPISKK